MHAVPAAARPLLSALSGTGRHSACHERFCLPSCRWIAPVVVTGVIAAGRRRPRLADASDAAAELPPRTAAELLQAVSNAEVDGLSGTVVATSKLGLPELPASTGGSAVSLPGLFAGSTTARVWKAGEDRSRIAVDAAFAEYDVVRDGSEVWTFDSASSDVTHLTLPEGQEPAPVEGAATPLDAAERLLASVEPTTEVTVGRPRWWRTAPRTRSC
jgi:hypothetical protein